MTGSVSSKSYQLALLSDIVQNVERIQNYVGDLRRDDFERDARTQDAVERCLERICEAAVRLGDDADALVPGNRGTISGEWATGCVMPIIVSIPR